MLHTWYKLFLYHDRRLCYIRGTSYFYTRIGDYVTKVWFQLFSWKCIGYKRLYNYKMASTKTTCSICNKTLLNKNMARHKMLHTKKFNCDACDFQGYDQTELALHVYKTHWMKGNYFMTSLVEQGIS